MVFVIIFLYIFLPSILIFLCLRFPLLNKIGIVLLSYIAGIILGNTGIIRESHKILQENISSISIVLGLSMILFTTDIRSWFVLAKTSIISFFLGSLSVLISVIAGYFVFKENHNELWKISGLLIGVYTGGTPNMAAIKEALKVNSETFVMIHTYDAVISGINLLFLFSFAKSFFSIYLKPFKGIQQKDTGNSKIDEDLENYKNFINKKNIKNYLFSLFYSIIVLILSFLIANLFPQKYHSLLIILFISTFSIILSFLNQIRNLNTNFPAGMYLIYIFCVVVGSMVNIHTLFELQVNFLVYISLTIFGSMFLHSLLCKIFRIDVDTFIITSVANIYSPPFVPVIANIIHNKQVILSGITTGIIGYAIGNYLGISTALILSNF